MVEIFFEVSIVWDILAADGHVMHVIGYGILDIAYIEKRICFGEQSIGIFRLYGQGIIATGNTFLEILGLELRARKQVPIGRGKGITVKKAVEDFFSFVIFLPDRH